MLRLKTVVLICLMILGMFAFFRFVPRVSAIALNLQISAGNDDVWVEDGFIFDKTATNVYLGYDGDDYGSSGIGLRFNSVTIPQGSTVNTVYLKFYAFQDGYSDINLHVACEGSDNAAGFTDSTDYLARSRTAYVSWTAVEPWTTNIWYYSVDISSALQTVINRAGWVSGNSIVVFCEDDGTSSGLNWASTYDDNPTNAPTIEISYSAGGGPPPSKVDLNYPSNASSITVTNQSFTQFFNYTPTFYASDNIRNGTLWMNYNGGWRTVQNNNTAVANNSLNTFAFVFNFSEQAYASKQYIWTVKVFNSTTEVSSENRTLTVNFFWSVANYPSLIDTLSYFSKRTDWTDPNNYTDAASDRREMAFTAYTLGYITQSDVEKVIDSSNSWMETLYCYYLGAKYGIENQTKIEWALDNATMMSNGLPETGTGYFIVYDRYVIQGYYWAEKYGYELSKWNKTAAYNNFLTYTGGTKVLEIFSNNTTYASTRWYDEYAETAELYLEFYKIGISGALAHAVSLWNDANTLWDTTYQHYDYMVGSTDYESEAGGFAKIFQSINNYTSLTNLTRLITDFGNRFLENAWGSPQWGGTYNVVHTQAISTERLQNSLESWSAILGMYDDFSAAQRANITKMMLGYDAYDPLWKLLMGGACFDSGVGGSSKFFEMSSDITPSFTYTLLGAYLLLTYAVVPENATTLANVSSDIRYEDINSYLDQRKFSLDISSRTLLLDLKTEGNVSFLFNQTITHDFLVAGLYSVTFASDWNSITSASLVSSLNWTWTLEPRDIQGYALYNTTINVAQNGVTIYSHNLGGSSYWILTIPQSTYNVSVYWLQNLLVNFTQDIHITADADTHLTCLAYPYIIAGTRYWIASNSTINTTNTTANSIRASFGIFDEDFNEFTTNGWQTGTGNPTLFPPGQLEMDAQSSGTCSLVTDWDKWPGLPDQYTVEFRLKVIQFGTSVGQQVIGIYDTDYWIPFGIFSDHILVGAQAFSTITDNNWHTWTLVVDHTKPAFDVYRDGVKLTSFQYVSATVLGKLSLDSYGGISSETLTQWDWIYIYPGLVLPTIPLATYVLVASSPTYPTYILGMSYDKTVCFDPFGYLVLNTTSVDAITISYANWGDLYVTSTDQELTAATLTEHRLEITTNGYAGDIGHLNVYCGSRGDPPSLTNFIATTYGTNVLSGSYVFAEPNITLVLDWTSIGTGYIGTGPGFTDNTLPQMGNLLITIAFDFPQYATANSIANGTLIINWTGMSPIYVWSVALGSPYDNWTIAIGGLPIKLTLLMSLTDDSSTIPIYLTIPFGADIGKQYIPCIITFASSGGSTKTVQAIITLELVGPSANVPDIMTYLFLIPFASIIVFAIFRRRSHP